MADRAANSRLHGGNDNGELVVRVEFQRHNVQVGRIGQEQGNKVGKRAHHPVIRAAVHPGSPKVRQIQFYTGANTPR